MKLRNIPMLFAVVVIAACGGAAEEPAATEAAAAPEEAPIDDAALVAALADDYVLHYNMQHASMVNDFFTEDAVFLPSNGSVLMDSDMRIAFMEAEMAASPTLAVTTDDVAVFGDTAVGHGTYSVSVTPEGGEAVVTEGSWMAGYEKVDGEWRLGVLLGNVNGELPADMPPPMTGDEPPPDMEDSPIAELMDYYATHFNMGHGSMVASRYAEDAVAAFAGQPKLSGRAAIEENMNARIAEAGNPQLTIHVVDAQPAGEEGFVFGGGWYEMSSDNAGNSTGAFLVLARAGDDGNLQIQWAASNGVPMQQ